MTIRNKLELIAFSIKTKIRFRKQGRLKLKQLKKQLKKQLREAQA